LQIGIERRSSEPGVKASGVNAVGPCTRGVASPREAQDRFDFQLPTTVQLRPCLDHIRGDVAAQRDFLGASQEGAKRRRLPTQLPDHTETEANMALHAPLNRHHGNGCVRGRLGPRQERRIPVHRGAKLKTIRELPVDAAA
jgi:hypothetical protein